MTVMTAPAANAKRRSASTPTNLWKSVKDAFVDPLDDDQPGDAVVVTTRRAISRVALVATETAGRFQREAVRHDPMTWMLSPRSLFGGASALDACLARDACLRGILLHGLSLGLDADAEAVDALAEDDGEDDVESATSGDGRGPTVIPFDRQSREQLRLFTATVVANDGIEIVQAFHASLAVDEIEIADRLQLRMGAASTEAVIVEGFDPAEPLVAALVSNAIADTLALVASDPASPLAAGLDLNVEQRFIG